MRACRTWPWSGVNAQGCLDRFHRVTHIVATRVLIYMCFQMFNLHCYVCYMHFDVFGHAINLRPLLESLVPARNRRALPETFIPCQKPSSLYVTTREREREREPRRPLIKAGLPGQLSSVSLGNLR